MSILSIAVKHLIAAGVTGDALVTAIAEMEQALVPSKSTGAIRQQRYRERNKPSQSVTSVTGDATPLDGSDGFLEPSLNSLNPTKENPPKGGQKKSPQQEVIIPPEWMPLAEWEGFKEMRNKIKKPMTLRAERLAIGKLEKFRSLGHDPTEILNQSIMNDYQDLYEPKEKNGKNRQGASKGWAGAGRTLAERYAAEAEREEQATAGNVALPDLRIAEGLREN